LTIISIIEQEHPTNHILGFYSSHTPFDNWIAIIKQIFVSKEVGC
jgi:hypothetical protein